MLRRSALGFCLALALGSFAPGFFASAQESTEPPPPVAAPRTSVMAEELPRAGAIAVFGANQPLGLEIVKSLAALNKQVMAVIPAGADRSALDALKVEVVTADPLVPDQLKEMFASAPLRAVVSAYDATGDVPAFGLEGTNHIIDATKATGVPRFVLVSLTGAGDSAAVLPWYIRFLRGDAAAGAAAAEAHLKTAGLDYTIVRAGWVIDDESSANAALNEGAPAFSWITTGDLARIVATTVDTKALSGKTATAIDPEHLTLWSVIF
jgi:uncharacterized protein YbjT (DUF2867 family)